MDVDPAPLTRAFSSLEVRSIDNERRELSGWATTPATDRAGDVVMSAGALFAPEIPLLLFHDHALPVGRTKLGVPTASGIPFTAKIAKIEEPGALKQRTDEAWQSVKSKVIDAVSIGFRPLDGGTERIESGFRFNKYEIFELSLCTVPMNPQAVIHSVKAAAAHDLAGRIPASLTRNYDAERARLLPLIQQAHVTGETDLWLELIAKDTALVEEQATERTNAVRKAAGLAASDPLEARIRAICDDQLERLCKAMGQLSVDLVRREVTAQLNARRTA